MNDADRLEIQDVGPPELDEIWDAIEQEMPFGRSYRMHFDRSGNAISLRDYLRLCVYDDKNQHAYRQVKHDRVGDYLVSTVWIGIDMGHGLSEQPLIFETMVFRVSTKESDLECLRYSTEEEALAGHERLLNEVKLIEAIE